MCTVVFRQYLRISVCNKLLAIAEVATSWKMALAVLLLLSFFWSLVCCRTFPYVSFMNHTLANHAYVDLSLVGDDISGSDSVQCITDLRTCCTSTDGPYRGDWYFPDGTRLQFSGSMYENRGYQRVYLGRRNNPTSHVGIYRCDIPTIAVYGATDISVRDTVYVGVYTGSGGNANWKGHYINEKHLGELRMRDTAN